MRWKRKRKEGESVVAQNHHERQKQRTPPKAEGFILETKIEINKMYLLFSFIK